jgi:hypothetical protein
VTQVISLESQTVRKGSIVNSSLRNLHPPEKNPYKRPKRMTPSTFDAPYIIHINAAERRVQGIKTKNKLRDIAYLWFCRNLPLNGPTESAITLGTVRPRIDAAFNIGS